MTTNTEVQQDAAKCNDGGKCGAGGYCDACPAQQGGELPQDETAAFEAAAKARGYKLDRTQSGCYRDDHLQDAWKLTQAALAQRAASVPAKELFAEKLAREMQEGTAVFVSASDVPAASVPDAGREAVGKVVLFGSDLKEVAWAKGRMPVAGSKLYTAPPAAPVLTDAAADVLAERQRQTSVENWTAAHDDKYTAHELLSAACCYAMCHRLDPETLPANWPWDASWWKPTTQRRNLIKATALILAEIERLDRAAAPQTTEKP